jgi:hypothetical protein
VVPHWLMIVSWIALALGFGGALVILADELLLGHRQHMAVMNVVHPVTALYWGPVWVWAYFRHGRKSAYDLMHREAERIARLRSATSAASGSCSRSARRCSAC